MSIRPFARRRLAPLAAAAGVFGGCSQPDAAVAPRTSSVSVSARTVPLPVGFQTQLFASGRDFGGNAVADPAWSTSNPGVLTVDRRGVVTATGVGSATVTATA